MDDKWIAVIFFFVIGGIVVIEKVNADVKVACYEAMKHNPNVKECGK